MTCTRCFVQILVLGGFLLGSIERVEAQISWDFEEPIDVAGDPYGNKCPRLVLDAEGNPVVFMGKNNDGLYVAISQNGVFNAPQPVPTDPGIFLSDAEGPDVATWGNTIGLAYQIAGQWATGAQYMVSEDGGVSWSPSYAIAPNATEDHFMPIPAFDENGNPFVGLKLGSGNSAQEGVLRSMDGGMTWGPAESASFAAGNGIACECCPSRTFYGNGRYYSIYRRNNNNIRDMWLVSSVDGVVWDQQLDLDPTDWQINACPETGTSAAWLPDGRLASVFMSAGNGSSQVYLNVSDPVADDAGSTTALSATQFSTINQNQPDIAVGATHTAVVWEQSSGGWEVQLSIAPNDALPSGLVDVAIPLSESLSGSNRHPDVAIDGNTVHVIWQNSAGGTVKYLRGTIDGASGFENDAEDAPQARLIPQGGGQTLLVGTTPLSPYSIYSVHGALIASGQTDGQGSALLESARGQSSTSIWLVHVQSSLGPQLLKLQLAP